MTARGSGATAQREGEAKRGLAWGNSEVAEAWASRGIRHHREAWDDALDTRHH